MNNLQQQTLTRLARCARWAEEYRVGDHVGLTGYRKDGKIVHEALSLAALLELVKSGAVAMDESPRISDDLSGRLKQVPQRYWTVVDA